MVVSSQGPFHTASPIAVGRAGSQSRDLAGSTMVAGTGWSHRYVPSLDGLRAIAVLLVMLVHSGLGIGSGGWIGVDVFFVLSGYLITSILIAEWSSSHNIDLRHFYLRRAIRLVPALVVFVVGTASMALLLSRDRTAGETILSATASIFYVSNWASAFDWIDMGPFEHTWSLAIEEQFYLLWPVALVILLRRRTRVRTLLMLTVSLVMASALARAAIFAREGQDHPWRTYAGFDTRADSLLVGCLLAVAISAGRLRASGWVPPVVAWIAFGGVVFLGFSLSLEDAYGQVFNYGGYTVLALLVACLIWALVMDEASPVARFLALPLLIWVGRISYALYLWHVPVFRRFAGDANGFIIALCFVASFVLAILSWYLVERPFLRARVRFRSAPARAGGEFPLRRPDQA